MKGTQRRHRHRGQAVWELRFLDFLIWSVSTRFHDSKAVKLTGTSGAGAVDDACLWIVREGFAVSPERHEVLQGAANVAFIDGHISEVTDAIFCLRASAKIRNRAAILHTDSGA